MDYDFYGSIDRLVEFGMNGNVAQHMIQTMNNAMAQVQLPDYAKINQTTGISSVTTPASSQKRFYAVVEDSSVGPLSYEELQMMVVDKKVDAESLVWYPGLPGWIQASKLSELSLMFA